MFSHTTELRVRFMKPASRDLLCQVLVATVRVFHDTNVDISSNNIHTRQTFDTGPSFEHMGLIDPEIREDFLQHCMK